MTSQVQRLAALAILHSALNGPDRMIDVEIGRALGWRVSHDDWWNWHPGPVFDPPGDAWCIRRDARPDTPCNEALPAFTFMPRHDAEVIIDAATTEPTP